MKSFAGVVYILLFITFSNNTYAQLPSDDEALRLIVAQKKATDNNQSFAFNKAPGTKPKYFPGHYTSKYNDECIVMYSLLQGREFIQVALLLYKSTDGYWKNACWYYDNLYRLRVMDFNKDSILEIILETKLNAGKRTYGSYRVISLIDQKSCVWYENNTIHGYEQEHLKNAFKGKEISKDVKVVLVDTIPNQPCFIMEKVTLGKFNGFKDSAQVNLDTEIYHTKYYFKNFRYVPQDN